MPHRSLSLYSLRSAVYVRVYVCVMFCHSFHNFLTSHCVHAQRVHVFFLPVNFLCRSGLRAGEMFYVPASHCVCAHIYASVFGRRYESAFDVYVCMSMNYVRCNFYLCSASRRRSLACVFVPL